MEDPVVVVGMSFRFPSDAVTEDSLWEIIRDGRSTMTEIPASRYNVQGHLSQSYGRQHGVSHGHDNGFHFICVLTILGGVSSWPFHQGRRIRL